MKLRKLLVVIIMILLLTNLSTIKSLVLSDDVSSSLLDRKIIGDSALLLDGDTKEILFAKDAYKKRFPASTTKILTALIALEKGNLDDRITVGKEVEMKFPNESTAWIFQGQELTLRQLLAGLMLPSGNDAARTIAVYIAKKESSNEAMSVDDALSYFARLMNERAIEIGANDSHFVNPHGLHDPKHYSTAYDIALIATEAMENKDFNELVSMDTYRDESVTYENRNQLIDRDSTHFYKGANGIKTGFTGEAGYCLVSSAERNGVNRMAVVLKSTEKGVWNDSIALLDMGFRSTVVKK